MRFLRILVVESDLLLSAGVKSLLNKEADIEIIGVQPHDEADLVKKIRWCNPNVVVLDEATFLTTPSRLLAVLHDFQKLRVLVISANSDLAKIYDKEQTLIEGAPDLISILHHA